MQARITLPPAARLQRPRRPWVPGLILSLATAFPWAATAPAAPLDATEGPAQHVLPADGTRHREVRLGTADRYAFLATGEQPVGVQLVDRMLGPTRTARDRRDHYSEPGMIKAVTHPAANATGDIELTVRPYRELNPDPLLLPAEPRLLGTSLADFQQRSYWLQVENTRWLTIEAAGRHLDDLRLWEDGEWLTAIEPEEDRINPESGRPLQVRRIHTRLQPGTYRLTAYGGPGEPWAEESEAQPLWIRAGIPELPAMGWWRHRTSPFGVDRWRVDTAANLFHLRLDEAQPARLAVTDLAAGTDVFGAEARAQGRLDKDSRRPEVTVGHGDGGRQSRLVTVTHAPGEPYRLSLLNHGTRYSLDRRPRTPHWIGVAGLRDPRDTVDATVAVVDRRGMRRGDNGLLAEQLPVLARERAWAGRFNLLRPVSMLIRVDAGGEYVAELGPDSEAMVEFRLQPLYANLPDHRGDVWELGHRQGWQLPAGLYRLSMRPAAGHPGIASVLLRHADMAADEARQRAGAQDSGRDVDTLGLVDSGRNRVALVNDFDHGGGGLIMRPVPLELGDPLPVTQHRESVRRLPVRGRPGGELVATTPDGDHLPVATAPGGPWRDSIRAAGTYRLDVHVRNSADHPVTYNLHWRQQRFGAIGQDALAPLPPGAHPPAAGAVVPTMDGTTEERLELSRQAQRSYRLDVDEPALYRLESTGLLDTSGELRGRTALDLASASDGGAGRNFLIQHYLRPGDYRLVAAARGRSAGPLGLQLSRTAVADRGTAPPATPVRATVEPGEALRYRVPVEERGRYRIHARGLRGDFAIQLDGPDGWPVLRPGTASPTTVDLAAGEHTLTVVPRAVTARMLLTVQPVPADDTAPGERGDGVRVLPLNTRASHLWREPEDAGTPRRPDRWSFSLDAPMSVRTSLGEPMVANLLKRDADGDWHRLQRLYGARQPQWLELAPGAYRLDVKTARPDNLRRYHLTVDTRELPLDQERTVRVPGAIPLSLAEARLVQLDAISGLDLQAELRDDDGTRLAFSDSRPDDWNFLISRQLAAGRYTLRVTTADGESGDALVRFGSLTEQDGTALAAGDNARIDDGNVRVHPLSLPEPIPERGYPLVIGTRSAATHGLSLEQYRDGGWKPLHSSTGRRLRGGIVVGPEDSDERFRLRAWPIDDVPDAIDIAVRTAPGDPATPGQADPGRVKLAPLAGTDMRLGPGELPAAALARTEERDALLWVGRRGTFRPVRDGWIPAADTTVWLLGDGATDTVTVATVGSRRGEPLQFPAALPLGVATDQPPEEESALRAWVARSTRHTPSLRAAGGMPATPGWAVADRSAVALALPGDHPEAMTVRRADGSAREVSLRLDEYALPVTDLGRLTGDAHQLTVPPGTAARIQLPHRQAAQLRLAAPAGVAALVDGDDGTRRTYWTGLRPRTLQGPAAGGTLWLANTASEPADISLAREPGPAHAPLQPGAPLFLTAAAAGERIIPVPEPDADRHLHLEGAVREAFHVDARGRLTRAVDGRIPLAAGTGPGRLHVRHGTGVLGAWLDGEALPPAGQADRRRLETDTDALLWLHADAPALLRLERADGHHTHRWLDGQSHAALLVTAGVHRLTVTGPAADRADAALTVTHTPVTPMTGGLEEAVRLAPGEIRAFGFRLHQQRDIGIGLNADREVAEVQLVNHRGDPLGTGITQMHRDLAAGDYYLVARLPEDETTVRVRPALVGLDLPDDAIPASIRERLSRLAEQP